MVHPIASTSKLPATPSNRSWSQPSAHDQNNSSTLTLSPVPRARRRRAKASRTSLGSFSVAPHDNNDLSTLGADELTQDQIDEEVQDDEAEEETLVERMRGWRNDAMAQHLLST